MKRQNAKTDSLSSRSSALILAGHGSHISPDTASLIWRYVDQLREWGVADEITACFWKEEPSFHQVLNSVTADEITIVPVFTAQGYFTQTVIPAEMALDGALTERNGRMVHYAATLGEHPYIGKIVRQRVEDVIRSAHLDQNQVAVAVIGHGTKRNPQSRAATQQQAEALRDIAAEVFDVYLDDEPAIPDIYTLTTAANLIAVPFFLASGSHTTIDVPHALGLVPGQDDGFIHGRHVYYTPPVGTDESICRMILELAQGEAAFRSREGDPVLWSHFPTAGRDALIEAVQRFGHLIFGQLLLTPDKVKPVDSSGELDMLTSPAALRQRVRENPFRPLPTSRYLPGGWGISIQRPEMLHAVVETVYPGLVADWAAQRCRVFQPASFEAVIERQKGVFRALINLTPFQVAQTVHDVCGGCIRHPTWFDQQAEDMPCAEPCNIWLSHAQEGLK